MKKIIPLILIIAALFTCFAFADTDYPTKKMKMDGKDTTFHVVRLKLNGNLVQSEVPPVLYKDRTLVPLYVMRSMGAEVEWDGSRYEVTVKTPTKTMVLKINSGTAVIDGKEKPMPDKVPPKIINDRTMVPVAFIANEMGYEVIWDGNSREVFINSKKETVEPPKEEQNKQEEQEQQNPKDITVKDVTIDTTKSLPQIRIKTSANPVYNDFKLTNPERLVLDLENAFFDYGSESNKVLSVKTEGIVKEVRASQFQKDPYITRVVIELAQPMVHQVRYDEKTGELVIELINHLRSVKRDILNMKEVIVINGDAVSDYSMLHLPDPSRLVFDIKGATLPSGLKNVMEVNGRVVKTIRMSQFSDGSGEIKDKIARIVVDLQPGKSADDVYVDVKANQLIVHLEGEPLQSMRYEETSWTTSKITIQGNRATNYRVDRGNGSNVLYITAPKEAVNLGNNAILPIGDHIIKNIAIEDVSNNEYRIKVELQDEVEHRLLTPTEGTNLVIELSNRNAKYRELLIVIDPGHGRDPGSVSPNLNLKESEVVLDIATRVNKLLTDAGFRTYMTRTDDSYVSLQERVDMANYMNADLFVSIHANATESSPTPNGLENLYYPSEKDPEDYRDNKTLAQIFQSEMIKHLNINSRGIVARPGLYVLKHTKMPAVLTETGFLTNPEEEAKLANSTYRQQMAEAIFKSIVKYFETVGY